MRAVDVDGAGLHADFQRAEHQQVIVLTLHGGAAQQGAQAGAEFFGLEGFREVIVGAFLQPFHPVGGTAKRGQHKDHGCARQCCAFWRWLQRRRRPAASGPAR